MYEVTNIEANFVNKSSSGILDQSLSRIKPSTHHQQLESHQVSHHTTLKVSLKVINQEYSLWRWKGKKRTEENAIFCAYN